MLPIASFTVSISIIVGNGADKGAVSGADKGSEKWETMVKFMGEKGVYKCNLF